MGFLRIILIANKRRDGVSKNTPIMQRRPSPTLNLSMGNILVPIFETCKCWHG